MASVEPKRPFFLAGKKRKKVITITGCLFLATVFWFFNALNNDYSTVIKYPVKVNYNPDEYALSATSTNYIKVNATGYGWYLLYYSLGIGTSPIRIDLEKLDDAIFIPNNKLVELAKTQLQNIEIKGIATDSFAVKGEVKLKKKIYLYLDITKLEIPNGKWIKNIKIQPDHIFCSGVKSEIDALPDSMSVKLKDQRFDKNYSGKALVLYREIKKIRQNTAYVNVSFDLD